MLGVGTQQVKQAEWGISKHTVVQTRSKHFRRFFDEVYLGVVVMADEEGHKDRATKVELQR